MNYTLSQIAHITGGTLVGRDRSVKMVVTDSRSYASTDALFVAINGVNHNGHDFITILTQKGVKAFLVEQEPVRVEPVDMSYVIVLNTLYALQQLATHHRDMFKGTVVAITGSNGKTIIKEWFAQLWDSSNGKLFRSPRSFNSQLGVALSLLMIEGDEKVAFIEAGISKPDEMTTLQQMIRPDIGIFTNLGQAHSENFKSQEELKNEKFILFKDTEKIIHASQIGDVKQRNIETVKKIYQKLSLNHKPVSEIQTIPMRLEVKEGINGSTIINDSYSCEITSLAIALNFMKQQTIKSNSKIVILSDLMESEQNYDNVKILLKAHNIEMLIAIGENITKHKFHCTTHKFQNTTQFLQNFQCGWFQNSLILIKGGRKFNFETIAHRLEHKTHTTLLEVNFSKMVDNLNYYKAFLKTKTKIMAMVKASSYGCGTVEVAALLQQQKVDYLAVAFVDEGVTLREGGITAPIVVLNADPYSYRQMIEHNLEPEIYSLESLKCYINEAIVLGLNNLPIHIKLDTGMHRLGFLESETSELTEYINNQKSIYVATIFSHLSASNESQHDEFTMGQITKFTEISNLIIKNVKQVQPICRHICNSSAIERFPIAHFDMVRLGIGLYTHTPISRLITHIVQIKELNTGDTVGYSRNGKITKPTTIAIIPIGYADGLVRQFGNGAVSFSVEGIMCPTIGNISMDTTILDITAANGIELGAEVEIFGNNPSVNELAKIRGTINYEVLTSVAHRIKHLYIY